MFIFRLETDVISIEEAEVVGEGMWSLQLLNSDGLSVLIPKSNDPLILC